MLNIQSFNMPSIIFYLGDTTQHFFHSGRTVLKKVITSLSYIILNTIVITTTLSAQNINTQENLLSNTDFYALNQKETSSLINDSVISVIGQWSYGPCYANVVQGSYDYIANGSNAASS